MQTKRAECLEDKADYETAAATENSWLQEYRQERWHPLGGLMNCRNYPCFSIYSFRVLLNTSPIEVQK